MIALDTIRLNAMAKINLGLDVTGKRPDGYHDVRMVMQMVKLYDRIDMEKTAQPGIHVTCSFPFLPCDDRNIAYKAARLMTERYGCSGGINIRIEKHIPVAAGMAGGSTDCAAVLAGMNRLYDLALTQQQLMKIGLELGADVPYCIMRHTALSEGIGEILTAVPPLADCHLIIAKPHISVSTKHVYQSLVLDGDTVHPDIDGIVCALKQGSLAGVASRLGNVLETVTVREHPVIGKIKERLVDDGALGALMSGSGPTVFGIFDDREKAESAYDSLRSTGLAQQQYLTVPVSFGN